MIHAQELNFSKHESRHGSYRMQKITPISGIPSDGKLLQSLTSVSNVTFEIPNKVYNLSKTYLVFDVLDAKETHFCHNFQTGFPHCETLSLQTRSGQYLVNLSNSANNLFFQTALVTRSTSKWHSSDIPITGTAISAATQTSSGVMRTASTDSTPAKFLSSGDAAIGCCRYQICLGDLAHCLFANPNDLFFNEILTLTMGFCVTAKSQAHSDATGGGTYAQVTVPTSISNVFLHLATEVNQDVIENLVNIVKTGSLTMKVPFVYTIKQTFTNSPSSTVSLRVSRNMGSKLLRVYSSCMASSNLTIDGKYYTPILAGSVDLVDVRSYIDNSPLQDSALQTSLQEVYLNQKSLHVGSAMENSAVYNNWFTFIDNFTSAIPVEHITDHSVVDGIDLTNEKLYSVTYGLGTTGDDAHTIYLHAVVQRDVIIGNNQVSIL